jgi:cellulose synthase/poly-beta-1,6-N-acetylglucosamine synthase-like glycosyltransferase
MVLWLAVIIVLAYFGLSVGYLLLFSLAGKFGYRNRWKKEEENPRNYRRIAVLVPAYKEDGVIMATAENLLDQDYPAICYDVHIIADSLERRTIGQLQTLPLHVWEVSFKQSTKTRSLNAFFSRNRQPYDLALICDADNMLDPLFLQKINWAFELGARAVQGRRVAKNMDTSFSILDACSEAINNHIFRRGASALGLSSSVIGSGMAFEYAMVKDILDSIDAVGGFDKPLQLKAVAQGAPIRYLEDALIFDEKIDSAKAFNHQRKRWLSTQYVYLKQSFLPGWVALFKGQVSYFNLAVANNIVPPRALLLGALPLFAVAAWFVQPALGYIAIGCWALYLLALAVALPRVYYRKGLGKALLKLPGAIGMMALNLLHVKSANKTFIHTLHTRTSISNNVLNGQHGH